MNYVSIKISIDKLFDDFPDCTCENLYIYFMKWILEKVSNKENVEIFKGRNNIWYDLAYVEKSNMSDRNIAMEKTLEQLEREGQGQFCLVNSKPDSKSYRKGLNNFLTINKNAEEFMLVSKGFYKMMADFWRGAFEISDAEEETAIKVIKTFQDREIDIVSYYYGIEKNDYKTLSETAKKYGLSSQRIGQLLEKGLRKLRHPSRYRLIMGKYWSDCPFENILYDDIESYIHMCPYHSTLRYVYMPEIIQKNNIEISSGHEDEINIAKGENILKHKDRYDYSGQFYFEEMVKLIGGNSIFMHYIPLSIINLALSEGYITIEGAIENKEDIAKNIKRDDLKEYWDDFCNNYKKWCFDKKLVIPISSLLNEWISKKQINNWKQLRRESYLLKESDIKEEINNICYLCYEFELKNKGYEERLL